MTGEQTMDLLTAAEEALASIHLPPIPTGLPSGAKSIQWEEFNGTPATTQQTNASKPCGNEVVDLRIELGRTCIRHDDVSNLRSGALVPLDNPAGDFVDLYADGQLVARGEVLAINGVFGVRVVKLLNRCA
jgi:flagellar motor switch/type III secretory pathway protein FliN